VYVLTKSVITKFYCTVKRTGMRDEMTARMWRIKNIRAETRAGD